MDFLMFSLLAVGLMPDGNLMKRSKRYLHPTPNASVVAKEGLHFCNQLFAIEREIKDLSYEDRYDIRLERSRSILDAFSAWLSIQQKRVLPKSAFGQAITYCRNQWDKLEAFILDGRLEINNNRSERSIKPFVIGRKNWLFANTSRDATQSYTASLNPQKKMD
jgi:transposase